MNSEHNHSPHRRRLLQAGLLAGLAAAVPQAVVRAADSTRLIKKAIPGSGQKIPAVGLGTNQFDHADYPDVRNIVERMPQLGSTVINTASAYRDSEAKIGQALSELHLTRDMFISTMFDMPGVTASKDPISGKESIERSFQRLQRVDLMFIHLILGVESMMPVLQQLKAQGRVRYIGITNVYRPEDNPLLIQYLRKYPLDFVQVPYSIGDRRVEEEILPLAHERKIAVMAAAPLGGTHDSLFSHINGRELPGWATDYNITSWGQFFLKYVISHPAITCAIPGSTKVVHLEDNLAAGRGALPDAAGRRKMEAYWAKSS